MVIARNYHAPRNIPRGDNVLCIPRMSKRQLMENIPTWYSRRCGPDANVICIQAIQTRGLNRNCDRNSCRRGDGLLPTKLKTFNQA